MIMKTLLSWISHRVVFVASYGAVSVCRSTRHEAVSAIIDALFNDDTIVEDECLVRIVRKWTWRAV